MRKQEENESEKLVRKTSDENRGIERESEKKKMYPMFYQISS